MVVPVKRLQVAKSRLDLPAEQRRQLAGAMAADTVAAALTAPSVAQVVVVSDDEVAAPLLRGLGAAVVPDLPDAGLNQALGHGIAVARERSRGGAVATLSADLPALTGDALAEALGMVRRRAVVADSQGTGTTLLAAAAGIGLAPAYGNGSYARHRAAGAEGISDRVAQRLRVDVDTLADLAVAVALEVGPHTKAVLTELSWIA